MYEFLHESKVNINMIMLLCNLAVLSRLLQIWEAYDCMNVPPDHGGSVHSLDDVHSNDPSTV